MSSERPIILGVEENRDSQVSVAEMLNGAGLFYRFVTDRRKLPSGVNQLKPDVIFLYGETQDEFVGQMLEVIAADSTMSQLPVVLVSFDFSDAAFTYGFRRGVVGYIPRPFSDATPGQIRSWWATMPTRQGTSSGIADSATFERMLIHMQRTRRSGTLVTDPRTPHEGKATFANGRLQAAKFLGGTGPQALKSIMSQPQLRWAFSEPSGQAGDGAGIVLEIGGVNTGETEVGVVLGAETPEAGAYEVTVPATQAMTVNTRPTTPRPLSPTTEEYARPRTEGPRILIVDDDEAILRMFTTLFKKYAFQVSQAHDGAEGVEMASTTPIDVVLADLNMPHLDGWGMLRLLREDARTRELPVAFVSAHDDYRESLRALNAGAQAYLSKGTKLEAIVWQVRKLLEPRETMAAQLTRGEPITVSLGVVGPQWFLRQVAAMRLSGTLQVRDGWAQYQLLVNAGQVFAASAIAGKFTATGERAFNAFIASRSADGVWNPGNPPQGEPNLMNTTEHLIQLACHTINANEAQMRDNLLTTATQMEINPELYTVYREVGPKQWLEAARLICEERVPAREIIARLDMSPVDIEDTIRDLVRRGVVTLKK